VNPRPLAWLGLVVGTAVPALAQSSPFVPEPLFRHLVNEISGDRGFEDVRHLSHFHRTGGSRDFFAATEWIRGAAEAAGLEDVKMIRQAWDEPGWSCASGEAWLLDPEDVKLASYDEVRVSIADHSRTAHVTAELVDVGNGVAEADYAGKDVKGKVVLASGSIRTVQEEAVWKRGALGVLSFSTNRPDAIDAPDQVPWGRLPYQAKGVDGVQDGTASAFAVMMTPRRGRSVQSRMAAAGKPLRVKIDIEASHTAPGEQAMVEAWIRGAEIHDEQIVLTAHIQEEMTSANDDGSGCASMLEIGRALARLVKEGKLERPRRDIRFWWVNELSSEPQYFHENPKEPRRMLLDIQQDMVAARQSWGGRVQYASRSPWSLPSALDDVMESVLTLVRDGNTGLLNVWRTSVPQPFSREITAVKGSREPYHARMVPFFAHSDHQAFVAGRVGVAANALINWPDEYIHSTGDDLENIDATQLERNAVVVGLVALWFAGAGDEQAAILAAHTAARGRSRIAADVATAIDHVAQAGPEDTGAAYRAARNLIHQAHLREQGALLWIPRLAPKGKIPELVSRLAAKIAESEGADLDLLEHAFTALAGRNPPNLDLGKDERAMAEKFFVPVADLKAYDAGIEAVKRVEGLHSVVQFEVFNLADGHRSAYDVYEAVAAEALAAGQWQYGTVKPGDVLEALQRASQAGAFTLRGK
jgi:hypothetical protein